MESSTPQKSTNITAKNKFIQSTTKSTENELLPIKKKNPKFISGYDQDNQPIFTEIQILSDQEVQEIEEIIEMDNQLSLVEPEERKS